MLPYHTLSVTQLAMRDSPLLFSLVSDDRQADEDERLQGDALEIRQVEGVAKDDLSLVQLSLHHTLKAVRNDQLKDLLLNKSRVRLKEMHNYSYKGGKGGGGGGENDIGRGKCSIP